MQQKLFQIFLPQEAGAFANNIEKESQKPRRKNVYIMYLQRIFALPAVNESGSFLQTCINFLEQRLRFSQFEGSIIH